MSERYFPIIASELSLQPAQVASTARLLAEGGTVPFIARYRKEATGSIDEVAIAAIRDRLIEMGELDQRKESIIASLKERNLLTEKLEAAVRDAPNMARLEDVYAPFKPRKRTRAIIAKEKGLEPLADWIVEHQLDTIAVLNMEAAKFVNAEKEVADISAALAGARDIIAERVSDDANARATIRKLFLEHGTVVSKVLPDKETGGAKFQDYFDYSEPLSKIPSHRLLAVRRGANEGFLSFRITIPEERAVTLLEGQFVKGSTPCSGQMALAVKDGYKRLLSLSMETEARLESKKKADTEAITVFVSNMRELFMASPLGQKRVLAIDPGFRTGCKVVCLDAQGALLHNDVVYATAGSELQLKEAKTKLLALIKHFKIEAIAIGNGTASRETETFVRSLGVPDILPVVQVNESGASIYSASDVAREEFPDHDLTVRGAVSIGRRLMDPLAELVKIDPKSIGVGQYQHDVDQNLLKRSLDDTVMSCVNGVGVEVNTASRQLLAYVSGLNDNVAKNVVEFRNKNGPFKSRDELKKVPRLGDKAFEQAAGFLRVRDGLHPLDASAVHPERYKLVEKMAADLGVDVGELIKRDELRKKIDPRKYVSGDVGLPTLQDILAELAKPGRDPRKKFEIFKFTEGVEKLSDLQVGMKLPGLVTNVTAFGAFVDIGVHQDGLVHVSELSDTFVRDPAEVVKVRQQVMATVISVDIERRRIALSLKSKPAPQASGALPTGQKPNRDTQSNPPDRRRDGDRNSGGNRPGQGGNRPNQGGGSGGGSGFGGDWFSQAIQKGKK